MLPVSFTFFWRIVNLTGTIGFLKMVKCLKKIILTEESSHQQVKTNRRKKSSIHKIERSLEKSKKPQRDDYNENIDTRENVTLNCPGSVVYSNVDNINITMNESLLNSPNDYYQEKNEVSFSELKESDRISLEILSSIESLLATIPFDKIKSSKENFFKKLWKRIVFYFKITEGIFFPNRNRFLNDPDLRNAFFAYHSNFLLELGTITVIYLSFLPLK